MATLITDVAKNVLESNAALNAVIQDFLDGEYYYGPSTTVAAWRIANYYDLRRWAYPNTAEYNDAQVKLNSGITATEEEGQDQLDDYVEDCLDIKTKFPKE